MIIPTLDSELYAFVKLAPKLKALGIKTFLPSADQLNIRGKDKLFNFCKAEGINVPKNILAATLQDIYRVTSELSLPAVVKGIFYEAYIANNLEETSSYFRKIANKWGYR